jgi:hypothetical protein
VVVTASNTGTLTINNDIAAGSGTVYLTSGAGITEGSAKITAATLGMNAAGTIAVNSTTNNVTTLAATTSSGTITYQDADALTVGSVAASGSFPLTTGVSTSNANVDIRTGGLLTINNDIAAGSGTVYLTSSAGITEGSAKITAATLGMNAAGAIDVNGTANNVSNFAAKTTAGAITYQDADGIAIATVASAGNFSGISGISANAGATNLTLTAGGAVTQATAADNIIASGLELKGAGSYALTNVGNNIATLAGNVTGAVAYTDTNSFTVGTVNTVGLTSQSDITLKALGAGDITVSNSIQKAASGAQTLTLEANENIVFNSGAGAGLASGAANTYTIVLNADRDASAGGAIQLNSGTVINSNGGSITLGGGASPLTTVAIGTGALVEGVKLDNAQLISGAGAINVRGAGLAGAANAHGISLTNSASVTSTSANITLLGTGGAGTGGSRGIYLSNGASVNSGSGVITLTGVGSGSGGSNVGVELSGSTIASTGSAIIQMTGTGAAGSNDIKLSSGSGSVGGSSAAGDILLNGTTTGGMVLGAGGDTVTLQTSGNITLNQTGGGISQGSGSVLANGLRLIGAGAFSLNQAGNNINVLVADLTGGATTLSYRDANGFSIGSGAGGLGTVKTAGGSADTTFGITVGNAATAAGAALALAGAGRRLR